MDGKIFARIGAVVFIAVALTVTVIEMSSKDDEPDALATRDRSIASQDPLASELRRCSGIGEAGPRDPGCPERGQTAGAGFSVNVTRQPRLLR